MHSLLIIAETEGRSISELMEPYWQDLEVEEYCEGEVPEMDKQRFLDYYNEKIKGFHFSMEQFDELYKEYGEAWNFNRWRKDDDGVWRIYSTANPDMKWDWYEVGGRWAGWLQLKEGVERMHPLNFSWGWSEDVKKKVLEERPLRADIARLGDINNLDILKAGAVMVDGEWTDIEENYIEFTKVKEHFKDLPEDTIIVCVDYHM